MAGRDDVASFIAGFAGDDRYVVDYLVEEVLQRQPEDVQTFLLQTSVLDRMTGSLCDALTGQDGGRAMLEALDRDNLFLVPLDDRRQWYRYHHLFADVLQARLLDEQPDRVGDLHRLASSWFQEHGDPAEAIRHAVAGGDFGSAAALMELRDAHAAAGPTRDDDSRLARGTSRRGAPASGRSSATTWPGRGSRPARSRGSTSSSMTPSDGWTPPRGSTGPRPTWSSWTRTSSAGCRPGSPSTAPGWRSCGATSTPRSGFARRALDVVVEDDHLARGAASALRGLAAWTTGDLEVAHASYAACLVDFERIDHVSDVLGCSIALADIQVAQGRLRAARRTFEQALELASRHGSRVLRGHGGHARRHGRAPPGVRRPGRRQA